MNYKQFIRSNSLAALFIEPEAGWEAVADGDIKQLELIADSSIASEFSIIFVNDASYGNYIWTGGYIYNTAGGNKGHIYNKDLDSLAEGTNEEFGDLNIASGIRSHAEGYSTEASGNYSLSIGEYTTASGLASHAEGGYTSAFGNYSHAEGTETESTGSYSHAEGYYTTASGLSSHAEGNTTTALGESSHAEGTGGNVTLFRVITDVNDPYKLIYSTNYYGSGSASDSAFNFLAGSDFESDAWLGNSVSNITEKYKIEKNNKFAGWIGRTLYLADGSVLGVITRFPDKSQGEDGNWFIIDRQTYIFDDYVSAYIKTGAAGESSHSEGYLSDAAGKYSHAEGERTRVTGTAAHGEGTKTQAYGAYSHAEGELTQALAFGSHTEGMYTHAEGEYAHAEGYDAKASGTYSHGEGFHSSAQGEGSHAEGNDTKSEGEYSHSEGAYTVAHGNIAHAEGYNTTAEDNYSHAEGKDTNAHGVGSHTEGFNTLTVGNYSHAEGNQTRALGNNSHTEGYKTVVEQYAASSHAEGAETLVEGQYSHAEGVKTETKNRAEHAQGFRNVSHKASDEYGNKGNTLFSVGAGGKYIEVYKGEPEFIGYFHSTDDWRWTVLWQYYSGSDTTAPLEYCLIAERAEMVTPDIADIENLVGSQLFSDDLKKQYLGTVIAAARYDLTDSDKASARIYLALDKYIDVGMVGSDAFSCWRVEKSDETEFIYTGGEDRSNALEITLNGDIYVRGAGNFNGDNINESKTLQLVLKNADPSNLIPLFETISAALNNLNDRLIALDTVVSATLVNHENRLQNLETNYEIPEP